MLSYTINKNNETSFIITYNFGINGLRPINFAFVYDCICPFNFKQINQFVDNSINQFNFTDNIYYTKNTNELTLTYYMHDINYSLDDSIQIMDTLKQSLQDIIMNKSYITQNKKENIKPSFSTLYNAIYHKQYDIIEWLLNNNNIIEFIDLEFSDDTSRNMIYNAKHCPPHIKMFLEQHISIESRKRKNDNEKDTYHSKIKCN